MRFSYRHLSIALLLLFTGFTVSAHAQSLLRNSDVSVSAFGQFTQSVTGNGITLDTSKSLGGQAAFRHSYHWWLGFEGSYNYTRFAEYYSSRVFPVQHNTHELAASYLVNGTSFLGFQPFALAGASAIVFSPSLNGGQNVAWQGKPGLNFGVGINRALLTSHFGIRVQYRGIYYKAPDFNEEVLTTGKYRLTSEPMAGVYFRF
ncbi:MAG: outer membrane beta-barrel protein [Silvibacterium sp.]